jgi:RNA polymerase sigma-70 factor (ECF subfamily)
MSKDNEIFKLMDNERSRNRGFTLLMNTYQKDVYWHIRGIVGSHEDTDDVIQNTFVKVFRYYDKFKKDSSLFTWIYKIATNESLTHLRKMNRHQTSDLSDNYTLTADSNQIDGDIIIAKLNGAIEILPDKQKTVFNMRYFENMTYQQISDVLNTSVGALKASYHFAVKKIEAELTK